MNRKIAVAILCGVLAAGIICLTIGLIVYFVVKNNVIATLISLFAIACGTLMAAIAVVVLLVILLISKLNKHGDNYDR